MLYTMLESRILAEESQALFIAELQHNTASGVQCQCLPDHSPDWRYLASAFVQTKAQTEESKLLQVYRVHVEAAATAAEAFNATTPESSVQKPETLPVFFLSNSTDVRSVLCGQFESSTMVFFSNPVTALRWFRADEQEHDDDAIICELVFAQVHVRTLSMSKDKDGPNSWPEVQRRMTSTSGKHQTQKHQGWQLDPGQGSVYSFSLLEREVGQDDVVVLPLYHVLMTYGANAREEAQLEMLFREMTLPTFFQVSSSSSSSSSSSPGDHRDESTNNNSSPSDDTLLDSDVWTDPNQMFRECQHQVEEQLRRYHARVREDLDPETAISVQKVRTDIQKARQALEQVQNQIQDEKNTQEYLLKSYRQHHVHA